MHATIGHVTKVNVSRRVVVSRHEEAACTLVFWPTQPLQ